MAGIEVGRAVVWAAQVKSQAIPLLHDAALLSTALEGAHPSWYFGYLMGAGVGLPLSEDALCVWVGATLARATQASGGIGLAAAVSSGGRAAQCLLYLYVGVVLSDMVTFFAGRALGSVGGDSGLLSQLKRRLITSDPEKLARVEVMAVKHGLLFGAIERASIGVRGPLCILAGFAGFPPAKFFVGVCLGAMLTLPAQLLIGYYMLRDSPSPYLAALALVGLPNFIGHFAAPALVAFAAIFSGIKHHVNVEQKNVPDSRLEH